MSILVVKCFGLLNIVGLNDESIDGIDDAMLDDKMLKGLDISNSNEWNVKLSKF